MKKLALLFVLLCSVAHANITVNNLPLGSASTTGVIDSIPFWNQTGNQTMQLHLSDLVNLPALQAQFLLMVPNQFGHAGEFLTTNGTVTSWAAASGGSNIITVVNGGDAAYAIQSGDGHIRSGTALTAQRTYTLDACTGANIGETHSIKNDSTQSFNLVISGNGGDTIDHIGTYTITPGGALPLVCAVAGNWDIRQ